MATKEVTIGSVGPYLYDDADGFDAVKTDGQLNVGEAPTDPNHVVRLQDMPAPGGEGMPAQNVAMLFAADKVWTCPYTGKYRLSAVGGGGSGATTNGSQASSGGGGAAGSPFGVGGRGGNAAGGVTAGGGAVGGFVGGEGAYPGAGAGTGGSASGATPGKNALYMLSALSVDGVLHTLFDSVQDIFRALSGGGSLTISGSGSGGSGVVNSIAPPTPGAMGGGGGGMASSANTTAGSGVIGGGGGGCTRTGGSYTLYSGAGGRGLAAIERIG
jgi:hypothetical protein